MPELTRRRRLLVLGICCLSLFIVGLDSTIVNLALPAIRADLDASVSKLQWTIDAYTLVLASLLMISGSTADRVGRRRTFQVGLVLFGLTFGSIEGRAAGWASPLIIGCFTIAVASLAGLVAYERRREEPLLEPRFFRSAPFSGAALIAVAGFAALAGFLFLNSLYLQEVRGFSALHAGLLTLPMAAMTVVFAPLSGWLVGNRGPRLPLVVAGLMLTASGLILSRLTTSTPTVELLVAYLVFGLGFGMLNAPITNAAVSGMPRAQAGVAAAIASTSRQVGASLGVAIVGTVLTARLTDALETGFVSAANLCWLIIAGCGALVLVLGLVTTSRWARRTADAVADDLARI